MAPALVIVAVAGVVVAANFGYLVVAGAVAAAVVLGLLGATIIHHRRVVALGDRAWWRR